MPPDPDHRPNEETSPKQTKSSHIKYPPTHRHDRKNEITNSSDGFSADCYRQTILAALAEVENARSADQRSAERAGLLEAIVEEARLTARLANVRYIEGEEDLLSVLDAQTSLSDAEDAQVIGWQERIFAQIALFRSSGGSSARRVGVPS